MIFDYSSEQYERWKEIHGINISRKLENETAFDGIVKIYSLSTGISRVDKLLQGKFFGEFFFESEKGLLLREFLNKHSWPTTVLVHFDLNNVTFDEILKTNSSYTEWPAVYHGDGKYTINVGPTKKVVYSLDL